MSSGLPGVGYRERFVSNDGVRIRYLDNDPVRQAGLPVVFVPGVTDFADEYEAMVELFESRRLLVIEMRGRGGSDSPLTSAIRRPSRPTDVEAVIAANGFDRFHVMTFSRGTTPALKWR